ncbi:hypothetical protein IW262DRAFT_1297794 [Armillaria fumosa]|nr:hypothetical protein IW262DRAFT_1297794 [Armillaria fumosa]
MYTHAHGISPLTNVMEKPVWYTLVPHWFALAYLHPPMESSTDGWDLSYPSLIISRTSTPYPLIVPYLNGMSPDLLRLVIDIAKLDGFGPQSGRRSEYWILGQISLSLLVRISSRSCEKEHLVCTGAQSGWNAEYPLKFLWDDRPLSYLAKMMEVRLPSNVLKGLNSSSGGGKNRQTASRICPAGLSLLIGQNKVDKGIEFKKYMSKIDKEQCG